MFFIAVHISEAWIPLQKQQISLAKKSLQTSVCGRGKKGINGNYHGMYQKRWKNHSCHEDGGESIQMVQNRNISALQEILSNNQEKNIVIKIHGTALSSILNYYNSDFGCENFLRIIDWMPYIIELDFEENTFLGLQEHCYIEKEFQGKK